MLARRLTKLELAAPRRPCEVDVVASTEEEVRAKLEELLLSRCPLPVIARVRVGTSMRTLLLGALRHEEALVLLR